MDALGTKSRPGVVIWASKEDASELHAALKALKWLEPLSTSQKKNRDMVGFVCQHTSPLDEDQIQRLESCFPHPFEHGITTVEPAGLSVNPHQKLRHAVSQWLAFQPFQYDGDLLERLPSKWERLGDLVVLSSEAFTDPKWFAMLERVPPEQTVGLWSQVASALGGLRLARQDHIANNDMRTPQLELLHGTSTWVEFTDYGVHFGFDAKKVMFSSGNITERHRIGGLSMKGETVVDAYAGAGYYTLPMLVRSGAEHVHACEMNPASIEGLTWAAMANGVEHKLTVHAGNNQTTLQDLKGIADRCHLGLLPSSEAVWVHAIRCLKPSGGWLHIHMNINKKEIDALSMETQELLQRYAREEGRDWRVTVEHIERVKSFSPGVMHVVFDVMCSGA